MDGNIIDLAIEKWQWLLDHPEVTWSGSGIYALSLTSTAVLAVAGCVFRRKKKSSASSDGEMHISTSGNHSPAIHGRDVTITYNSFSPDALADVRKMAVTDAALASFFKILEEPQVPLGDLDSKLREFACQYQEFKLRLQVPSSDDPEVNHLKKQAEQAFDDGRFSEADALLNQAKERDRAAVAKLKASLAEQQAALEKRQLSEAASCANQAELQRLQYRYEKAALYFQEAAAALPEGCKAERAEYLGWAGYHFSLIARYTEALRLCEQGLSIERELGDRKQEAMSLNNISQIYKAQGEYSKALDCLEQSLPIRREVGDKEGEGTTLNNIGTLAYAKGDYPKALKYLEQSLLVAKEMQDKEGEGSTLNNIGLIHHAQGDYAAALQYFKQALAIAREIKEKATESNVLNNISTVYYAQENYDAALEQSEQSLTISQQIGDRRGEGTTLNNIGLIYAAKTDYAAAMKQYEQALAIAKEIGDKAGESTYSWNIGLLYMQQGELAKAEQYISQAVELGTQLERPDLKEWREALEAVRAKLRGRR